MQTLIDYISFSDTSDYLDFWCEFFRFPLSESLAGHARYGWSEHRYFNGIHIHSGGREDCFFEFSGVGCRTLESLFHNEFDWLDFLNYIADKGPFSTLHVSRLDIASDDTEGILSFPKLYRFTRQHKYISRSRRVFWSDGCEQQIVFGAPQSNTRLRIYNKALERGLSDEHWIRAEFQLRNDAAYSFLQNLKLTQHIGKCYSGVMLNYLRYTVAAPDSNNNNNRIDTVSWWSDFLGECSRLKNIYVGGLEYNRQSLNDYIRKQCSSSLKLWLELNGGDLTELARIAYDANLNPKQLDLLRREKLKEGSTKNVHIPK